MLLGYIPPRTATNERYVAVLKIQHLINQGYTDYQIGLIWNHGRPREVRGINSYGVEYDSALYARAILRHITDIKNE